MTDPHGPDPKGTGQTKCAECDRGNAAYPYDGDTSRMMHDIRAGDRTISCVPCRNGSAAAPAARAAADEQKPSDEALTVDALMKLVEKIVYHTPQWPDARRKPLMQDLRTRFTSLRARLAAAEQERDAVLDAARRAIRIIASCDADKMLPTQMTKLQDAIAILHTASAPTDGGAT